MSSPPSPRDFNGLIEEDWPGATKRPDVMAILEPYREHVDHLLDDFDDETHSWRDYCGCIYGYAHDDGALPRSIQKAVQEMMATECHENHAETQVDSATVPEGEWKRMYEALRDAAARYLAAKFNPGADTNELRAELIALCRDDKVWPALINTPQAKECYCCKRANKYNGYGSGVRLFECPIHCYCHD